MGWGGVGEEVICVDVGWGEEGEGCRGEGSEGDVLLMFLGWWYYEYMRICGCIWFCFFLGV